MTHIPQEIRDLQCYLRKSFLHISSSWLPDSLQADVLLALSQPGKLFEPEASEENAAHSGSLAGQWAMVPWFIASYVAASSSSQFDENVATHISLAVECLICALDLFDDVQDQDSTPLRRQVGTARMLNTAIAIYALSQQFILTAETLPSRKERILNIFYTDIFQSITGQHHDILLEKEPYACVHTDTCFAIIRQKSGALLSLTCALGLLIVSEDIPSLSLALWREFGQSLGIIQQLINDRNDMARDFTRHKKTLPLIFMSQCTASPEEPPTIWTHLLGYWDAYLHQQGVEDAASTLFQQLVVSHGEMPILRYIFHHF